jgi:hypothetical protein
MSLTLHETDELKVFVFFFQTPQKAKKMQCMPTVTHKEKKTEISLVHKGGLNLA